MSEKITVYSKAMTDIKYSVWEHRTTGVAIHSLPKDSAVIIGRNTHKTNTGLALMPEYGETIIDKSLWDELSKQYANDGFIKSGSIFIAKTNVEAKAKISDVENNITEMLDEKSAKAKGIKEESLNKKMV